MGKARSSLRYLLKRKYQVAPLPQIQDELADWFDDRFGQSLYQAQKDRCEQIVSQYFGYRFAQLGVSPRHTLLEKQQPSHKFILSRAHNGASCQCEFDALPLPSDTVDIVLLHHVLDFSSHPHQALIEAARLVTAGGHIVIIGFDPFSLFGLYKWLGVFWPGKPIWRHNSLRKGRIVDWLQLLGFQVNEGSVAGERTWHFSLIKIKKKIKHFDFSCGTFYMVVAQKTVTPVRPVRQGYWSAIKIRSLSGLKQAQRVDGCPKKQGLKK